MTYPKTLYFAQGQDPHEDDYEYFTNDLVAAYREIRRWERSVLPNAGTWEPEIGVENPEPPVYYRAHPPYPKNDDGYYSEIRAVPVHQDLRAEDRSKPVEERIEALERLNHCRTVVAR